MVDNTKTSDGGLIQDRLRGHYVTGINGRRDFSPYVPPISIEAADRIDALEDLIKVCQIYSGYPNCGYNKMNDDAQRALYDEILNREVE